MKNRDVSRGRNSELRKYGNRYLDRSLSKSGYYADRKKMSGYNNKIRDKSSNYDKEK